jgi:hypothetical protein
MVTFALKTRYSACPQARIIPAYYPGLGTRGEQMVGWHVMGDCGEGYEENLGSPTVNLAPSEEVSPAHGCVFIKITKEFEGYLESLMDAKLVAPTGRIFGAGYVKDYAVEVRVLDPSLLVVEPRA